MIEHTVSSIHQLTRIRIARDAARDTVRPVLERALSSARAYGGRGSTQLALALADIDNAVSHLDAALRLTDPSSQGPLARRADEDRTAGGS